MARYYMSITPEQVALIQSLVRFGAENDFFREDDGDHVEGLLGEMESSMRLQANDEEYAKLYPEVLSERS